MKMNHEHVEVAKAWLDLGSLSILAGWWLDLMPAIATTATAAWTLIRLWETKTVQRWVGRK
jgi:hypothetical protein